MSKEFAPRVSRKSLTSDSTNTNSGLPTHLQELLKRNDEKLLRGAQLQTVKLNQITVREQVRTKFNDDSLKELAENIKTNGLIQPLVIHREKDKFVLICGERRFRAMNLIQLQEAPCFILENKNNDELMAIQFSENSAREELHYIDKADGIYHYHMATGASERKIQAALGISKSEVHRSLLIAKVSAELKEAAKKHNIEKYVLLEWEEMPAGKLKNEIKSLIISGQICKRLHLKKIFDLNGHDPALASNKKLERKKVPQLGDFENISTSVM